MASTTALFTGLSGLNAHARNLDVIGNNIANANTTAFKSSRLLLAPQITRTFSNGTPPGDTVGGANPMQVGLGVGVAAIQRDFRTGSISTTGDPRDLAVEGNGFFIVQRGADQFYTRAGAFRQNADGDLVTVDGDRVQGFGVDANYNILTGALRAISIPVGALTIAEATRNVRFRGNLNAAGDVATRGAQVSLSGTTTAGLALIPGATIPPGPGNRIEATSLLSEIEDPLQPGSGQRLFAPGEIIELRGAEKGGRTLPTAQFIIQATSLLQDFMGFLNQSMGLHAAGTNPDGNAPGASIDAAAGILNIHGNTGTVNDLDIQASGIRLLNAGGAFVRAPFAAQKVAASDGESVRTTFVVYDSLGSPLSVDMAMVMQSKGDNGTAWRYLVDSADDSDLDLRIASGLVEFDTAGQVFGPAPGALSIDRAGTGAASPLQFNIAFDGGGDTVTALAGDGSAIAATYQDGSPIGTLRAFGVRPDGVITGSFSNGLTRTLGQVALATFTNQEGLIDEGANLFRVGTNSGPAAIAAPGELGSGRLVGGALEVGNVDLGQEFINMILTSTGYSASSRIIRTTDELLQQLLVIGR